MPSFQNPPWPTQTPLPYTSSSSSPSSLHRQGLKRRRSSSAAYALDIRDVVDESGVQQAEYDCEHLSGNDVITCFPNADSVFPQHQWATVVWNSRLPQFSQTDSVNVYLVHADSRVVVHSFLDQPNPTNQAGSLTYQVNDTWFGSEGATWNGSNITYSFYWVVIRNDSTLDGSELTQTHFQAVQTTFADSILSSMTATSTSTSARSSSTASSSTVSVSAAGGSSTNSAGSSGSVQSNGGDSSGFPHWAIAVIVVLGFLAIATTCILAFFILRRIRHRNQMDSNRNSMGSSSPMMANVGHSPGSPLLAAAGAAGLDRRSSVGHGQRAPSIVSPDGASTVSRTGSAGDTGPFSGADAAIMADAFRKALRKPDFADAPLTEGDSPDTQNAQGELLNRELADEGRDIRSVSSSRGVRVETLSDNAETLTDDHHR